MWFRKWNSWFKSQCFLNWMNGVVFRQLHNAQILTWISLNLAYIFSLWLKRARAHTQHLFANNIESYTELTTRKKVSWFQRAQESKYIKKRTKNNNNNMHYWLFTVDQWFFNHSVMWQCSSSTISSVCKQWTHRIFFFSFHFGLKARHPIWSAYVNVNALKYWNDAQTKANKKIRLI